MALTNCTECGSRISDKALSCPLCGCPEPIPYVFYECPVCSMKFQSSSLKAGADITCTSCHHKFLIPSVSTFTPERVNNKRYPNLRLYLRLVFIFTLLSLFIGCIAGIVLMFTNTILGILLLVGSIFSAIATCAFIEFIGVVLDIEASVRILRKNG